MGIDGAINSIVIIAPEVLEEKLATENTTRVRGKQQQEFVRQPVRLLVTLLHEQLLLIDNGAVESVHPALP